VNRFAQVAADWDEKPLRGSATERYRSLRGVALSAAAPAQDHEVTLVTRRGCHLCEAAEATLRRLAAELGFRYAEVDVDGSAQLRDEYSDRVPVILIDGREHGYWRVEEERFRRALAR
jgi:glutaredoxin